MVQVRDPPDHPRLRRQDQEPVQPPGLRDGGGEEDARRRLADDPVGLRVEDPQRLLDPPAIGEVVTGEVGARCQPLPQPLEVRLERRGVLALRGHERARQAEEQDDRDAEEPGVGDHEGPEGDRAQGGVEPIGELDDPGGLVDDQDGEGQQDGPAGEEGDDADGPAHLGSLPSRGR